MRLMIVDDEERTRELLSRYIAWEEMGISGIETAKNGQVALQMAIDWKPDIILCDVRMPKMNGIEFAKQYRVCDPQCKLIFLSGFSDKEYLKSAIHVKALSYIEKPVNLEEVRTVVEDAVLLCKEEERKQKEEKRLQAHADRSLPFLRQEMVRKLIKDPESAHVRPALQSRETFLIPLQGPYTVGAAALYWHSSPLNEDPSAVQERMLHELNSHPRMQALNLLFGFDAGNWLIFVFPGVHGSSYREQRSIVEQLTDDLRQIAGEPIDLRVGIGEPAASLEDIPHSYQTAVQSGLLQFYREDHKPLFYETVSVRGVMATDWEEIRQLREVLRKGELDAVKLKIRRHTELAMKLKDLDTVRVKDSYFQLLLAILEVAVQQGLTEQPEDTERRYIWKEIDCIPSLSQLHTYLLSFLEPFEDNHPGIGSGTGMPVKIREIIRYIHAHFHEKGFNIQAIAQHVNLSETYLCAYFKKQRDQTIKEFITETRLEQAKTLLRERELKLYEVALRLGFADANYFTTFFKRCTGCTPSEYRERTCK